MAGNVVALSPGYARYECRRCSFRYLLTPSRGCCEWLGTLRGSVVWVPRDGSTRDDCPRPPYRVRSFFPSSGGPVERVER